MHYISEENASRQIGIPPRELQEFVTRKVVVGVIKNGHRFYSSREIYRLKAIRFLVKTQGYELDRAIEEADKPHADQTSKAFATHS